MKRIIKFIGKGVGHEIADTPCQDRLGCKILPDKTILAVADGCSSSKYAELAAQCNVDIVMNIFSHYGIDSLSRSSLAELYPVLNDADCNIADDDISSCFEWIFKSSLANVLPEQSVEKKDVCATVLFAVWQEDKVLCGHIGDGNIICFDKDGNTVFRSAQDNGKDSSHTYFTVSHNFREHFKLDVTDAVDINSIILFSDGPQTMFKYERSGDIVKGAYDIVVEPAISGTINSDEELKTALSEPIGHAKHYVYDDWSIVVAHKYDGEFTLSQEQAEPVSLYQIFKDEFNKLFFDESGNIVKPASDVQDEKCDEQQSEEQSSVDKETSTSDEIQQSQEAVPSTEPCADKKRNLKIRIKSLKSLKYKKRKENNK